MHTKIKFNNKEFIKKIVCVFFMYEKYYIEYNRDTKYKIAHV